MKKICIISIIILFSEYWTFIRRSVFAGDTKEKKENSCPD
jgi:hypothetical protein